MSKESRRTVLPTKLPTAQDHESALPKREVTHYDAGAVDSVQGHETARAGANFDEKIYWMPESFNALRRELHENWRSLFGVVGHAMAFDAVHFVELMDDALDTKTTFDSAKVDSICKKYLDLLRMKRGLSPLHPTANWAAAETKIALPGKDF